MRLRLRVRSHPLAVPPIRADSPGAEGPGGGGPGSGLAGAEGHRQGTTRSSASPSPPSERMQESGRRASSRQREPPPSSFSPPSEHRRASRHGGQGEPPPSSPPTEHRRASRRVGPPLLPLPLAAGESVGGRGGPQGGKNCGEGGQGAPGDDGVGRGRRPLRYRSLLSSGDLGLGTPPPPPPGALDGPYDEEAAATVEKEEDDRRARASPPLRRAPPPPLDPPACWLVQQRDGTSGHEGLTLGVEAPLPPSAGPGRGGGVKLRLVHGSGVGRRAAPPAPLLHRAPLPAMPPLDRGGASLDQDPLPEVTLDRGPLFMNTESAALHEVEAMAAVPHDSGGGGGGGHGQGGHGGPAGGAGGWGLGTEAVAGGFGTAVVGGVLVPPPPLRIRITLRRSVPGACGISGSVGEGVHEQSLS